MRQAIIYTARDIKEWDITTEVNGEWIPARPYGHNMFSFISRISNAVKVLFGYYDILDWEQ